MIVIITYLCSPKMTQPILSFLKVGINTSQCYHLVTTLTMGIKHMLDNNYVTIICMVCVIL